MSLTGAWVRAEDNFRIDYQPVGGGGFVGTAPKHVIRVKPFTGLRAEYEVDRHLPNHCVMHGWMELRADGRGYDAHITHTNGVDLSPTFTEDSFFGKIVR